MGGGEIFVRIESESIVFPTICPVCSKPATDETMIAVVSERERINEMQMQTWDRVYRADGSYPRRIPSDFKKLVVPVCRNHVISFLHVGRLRAVIPFIAGFSLLSFLTLSMMAIFQILDGSPFVPLWFLLLLINGVIMIVSFRILSPTELERSISVVDATSDRKPLLLRMTRRNYADELIRVNPSTAKEVGMENHRVG